MAASDGTSSDTKLIGLGVVAAIGWGLAIWFWANGNSVEDDLRVALTDAETQLQTQMETSGSLEQMREEIATIEPDLQTLRDEQGSLEENVAQLSSDRDGLQTEVDDLTAQRDATQEEVAGMEE